MNMSKRPKFMLEIEAMSKEEVERRANMIKEKFKNVFDELAKH